MLQRYEALRVVVEALVANPSYKAWLAKQDAKTKAAGAAIRLTVQDTDHWDAVALTLRVLLPALNLLRLVDGKTGATLGKVCTLVTLAPSSPSSPSSPSRSSHPRHPRTLGKVYGLFANLNQAYREDIVGIDKTTRERMDKLFLARWTYFHDPVFTGFRL